MTAAYRQALNEVEDNLEHITELPKYCSGWVSRSQGSAIRQVSKQFEVPGGSVVAMIQFVKTETYGETFDVLIYRR